MNAVPCLLLTILSLQTGPAPDTVAVHADNPPVWGEALRLVEELRLGAIDGDEAHTFGRITGVVVDGTGVMWVADNHAATVRRFAANGQHIGNVGGPGEGPGEFASGSWGIALKVVPEGRIAAWDVYRSRLSIFAPDGTFLDALTLKLGGMTSNEDDFRALVVDTTGNFYVWCTAFNAARRPGPTGPTPLQYVKFAQDGKELDRLVLPPSRRGAIGGRSYPFGTMDPFTFRSFAALSPHGYLMVARNDRYAIHRPLRDGRVLRIERLWEAVPVQRAERAQYRARAEAYSRRYGTSYGFGADIPAEKPPFWAIRVDDEGRLWVARHQKGSFVPETPDERARRERIVFDVPPLEWWEPLVVDVIDPNGQFLGTLRFPNPRTTVAVARGRHVWAVELGEFDEQYLVRYRIEAM
jgi:hypothetical protein